MIYSVTDNGAYDAFPES